MQSVNATGSICHVILRTVGLEGREDVGGVMVCAYLCA